MKAELARCLRRDFGSVQDWPVAVTLPARNEARRIVACLDAAAASLQGRGGIVLVVNGSRDATFALAERWFRATGANGILLNDRQPPPGSGVGRVRRLAVATSLGRLAPGGVIMTSDSDSSAAADWVSANLSELTGADLICGTVLPDPKEFSRLPVLIAQRGAPEGEYMALSIAARGLLDPVPWDRHPAHLNAAGASMAFRADLYADVGGFDDTLTGEDRAFAAAAEARDWRVRYSGLAKVSTTCRLEGRAPGGMAGALAARVSEPDPFVDEVLETADRTIRRLSLRGSLRRRFGAKPGFGPAWAAFEASRADLGRERLRLSDLPRELPLLRAALDRIAQADERRIA